jgi:hypothetical protein
LVLSLLTFLSASAGGYLYENHDVNTPPFMAGMKRHPLKMV